MTNEFIPYEEALELKELGFDKPCLGCYYEDKIFAYHPDSDAFVDAPLYQQAFRWFREKYNLHGHVRESLSFENTLEYVSQINGSHVNHGIPDKPINRFDTYEEAELACLRKLIEIVKDEKKKANS